MTDWEIFADATPWFVSKNATVVVTEGRCLKKTGTILQPQFPSFATLVNKADVTEVVIDDVQHELLAWDSKDGERIGWICPSPPIEISGNVCAAHQLLLQHFGGVLERFNEPEDTRLLNHNSALTNLDSTHDASFLNDYSWAFDGPIPIDQAAYYTIAREANGNTTICRRNDGSVLLFAPDHCFDDVTPLDDCPELTLYTINEVATLTEWVESISRQWLSSTMVVG